MTETTPEQLYWKGRLIAHRITVIVFALAIAILVIMLMRGCKNQSAAIEAYNSIKDTLKMFMGDTARNRAIARAYKKENADLDLRIAELIEQKNIATRALIEKENKIISLAGEVKRANEKKDTPTLVNRCLELADSVQYYRTWLDETWAYETELDKKQEERIRKADSLAAHWERAYNGCERVAEYISNNLQAVKPTGKWYATGGGFNSGPVFGGTGGITHVSKKGLLIAGKGMITNYGPGAMVEVGLPLGLKRK